MRTTTTTLLLIAVAAVAGCGGEGGAAESDSVTFTVARGDLSVSLTEDGTLQARHKTDVRPKIRTGAKILSVVDEGTIVKEGDVLVELDKESTENEIERLQDQVIEYETALNNAETDLEIQLQENESNVDRATLDLEFARKELKRYMEGDLKALRRDLKLRIDKAKSRLKQATDRFANMDELLEEGFVTEVEYEEKRLQKEEAQVELESAIQAQELFEAYTRPMDERQRQADVTEAEREYKRVLARAEAKKQAKEAVVRQKRRQYESAVTKLEEAKKELESLTIYAPQDGIVIYSGRSDRWGNREESVQVGGTAYPGRTLIELPDLTRMNVKLQVHQADVNKLKIGQEAIVTVAGRRSRALKGKVAEIGSIAQSRSWRDPVKRFEVIVTIDDRVEGLRAGVTVECEIRLGSIEDVLYVPVQSVSATGGGYSVYVRKNGEARKRSVRLGSANEQYVVVKEGLEEGEQVLLVHPEMVAEEGEDEEGNGNAGPPKRERSPERGGGKSRSKRPSRSGNR